ncbi:MAG: helix-turn-helix transcriptional regulator [Phycisphaerae bacterium]
MQQQDARSGKDAPLDPIMLTADGVATLLSCSPRTVHRLVGTGRIPPPVRLGAMVRWSRKTIDAWVAAGCPNCRDGRR